ncbi:MAG: alpha/beta fold hydrolase, partial [Stellaceae bacterium]
MSEAFFSETTVAADGVRLRCRAAGTGASVVCLHGGGGPRLSRAHALLAESHRVLALDLPGFGDAPPAPENLAEFAALMNGAVTALGAEHYGLMAHGVGAGVALAMAIKRPEPVEAIVLLAPMAIRPRAPLDRIDRELLYAHPERQSDIAPLSA